MIPSHLDFRVLKRTVRIERLLAHRGHTLRRQGRRRVGPCPVHGGDNPTAFVVDPDKNTWFCFTGCGRGGDVVDLVRIMDQVDYARAALTLAQVAGLPEVVAPLPRPTTPRRPFRPYTRTLPLDPTTPFLRQKGIQTATARAFEAGAWRFDRGFLARCVGVRLHDPAGAPLGYAGRRLVPSEIERYGKWKLPTAFPKSHILFGWHRVGPTPPALVVVECPWGVMRLAQLGVPAVALLGVHASPQQHEILRVVDNLVLLLDGDAAGVRAAERLDAAFRSGPSIHVARLPNGADPDDLPDDHLRHVITAAIGDSFSLLTSPIPPATSFRRPCKCSPGSAPTPKPEADHRALTGLGRCI